MAIIATIDVIHSETANASHIPVIPNRCDIISAHKVIPITPRSIEVINAHTADSVALK